MIVIKKQKGKIKYVIDKLEYPERLDIYFVDNLTSQQTITDFNDNEVKINKDSNDNEVKINVSLNKVDNEIVKFKNWVVDKDVKEINDIDVVNIATTYSGGSFTIDLNKANKYLIDICDTFNLQTSGDERYNLNSAVCLNMVQKVNISYINMLNNRLIIPETVSVLNMNSVKLDSLIVKGEQTDIDCDFKNVEISNYLKIFRNLINQSDSSSKFIINKYDPPSVDNLYVKSIKTNYKFLKSLLDFDDLGNNYETETDESSNTICTFKNSYICVYCCENINISNNVSHLPAFGKMDIFDYNNENDIKNLLDGNKPSP